MRDIYSKVDNKLLENNYWNVGINEKKLLIDMCLKEYIIEKIQDLKLSKLAQENIDMTLIDLFKYLASLIPKEEHSNTIVHFIHYILGICSNLQSWSITWWQEDEDDLIQNPVVDFNIDSKWDTLTTNINTDYVKTFEFVYNVFCEKIVKSRDVKKLELIANKSC